MVSRFCGSPVAEPELAGRWKELLHSLLMDPARKPR